MDGIIFCAYLFVDIYLFLKISGVMSEIYFKIIAAIAPAIVLAMIMIRKDNRPEPNRWLWAAVGLGLLICPVLYLLAFLGWPIIEAESLWTAFLTSFVTAAIPEECLKFVALLILARCCKHFDEYFDGIVYAVCIGMGFAAFENITYVFENKDWIFVSIARALMSVPMHYVFAIIMGAFFSLGWFDKRNRKVYLSGALILPIIVHGIYDFLCYSLGLSEGFSSVILLVFILGFRWICKYVKFLTDSMLKLDEYETT